MGPINCSKSILKKKDIVWDYLISWGGWDLILLVVGLVNCRSGGECYEHTFEVSASEEIEVQLNGCVSNSLCNCIVCSLKSLANMVD